jgi:ATP-dependent DNA helicase RecQ
VSVARLARELRLGPSSGGWKRVETRRRTAFDRIAAVQRYAETGGCRRAQLLAYFGERLIRCAGCDRCATPARCPADPGVRRRMRELVAAMRGLAGPWNGDLIDARTVRHLAENPPADAAALASIPGIGPELASRIARRVLAALHADGSSTAGADPGTAASSDQRGRLEQWRRRRARELAIAPWTLAPDALLDRLVERNPRSRQELARCEGVGPRFLATEGEAVLAALRGVPAAVADRSTAAGAG